MIRIDCYVRTVGGWSLYLIPCQGGYTYEWRGKAQMDDRILACGHSDNGSRKIAEAVAEAAFSHVMRKAQALREQMGWAQ